MAVTRSHDLQLLGHHLPSLHVNTPRHSVKHNSQSGTFLHLQHRRRPNLHLEKHDGKRVSSLCGQGRHACVSSHFRQNIIIGWMGSTLESWKYINTDVKNTNKVLLYFCQPHPSWTRTFTYIRHVGCWYMLMVQMMVWLQSATPTNTQHSGGEGCSNQANGCAEHSETVTEICARCCRCKHEKPRGEPEPHSHSVLLVEPPPEARIDF